MCNAYAMVSFIDQVEGVTRIVYIAYVLNLAVQDVVKKSSIARVMGRAQNIAYHFCRSF